MEQAIIACVDAPRVLPYPATDGAGKAWYLAPMINRLVFPVVAGLALVSCGGGSGGGGPAPTTPDDLGGGSSEASVTYHNAVGPLLDRYCVSCHRPGGQAPFPLTTYDEVYGKQSALVYVLETGAMPPAGYADLGVSERDMILAWLESGAPEGDPGQAPLVNVAARYSYHADARAIIEEKCGGCHEPGGIAPFPLDSYDSVVGVAAAAAYAIETGAMPPWPPTTGYTPFQHDRSLDPQQRHILLNWLQSDLPEGDEAAYQAPVPEGTPERSYNLQLPLPQAYTPTLRPDDHRCFAIEWPLDEFAYVTAVDVLPDRLEEVHHVIVSVAEPEDAHHYYAAGGEDGRPGWYCLGAGGVSARGVPLPRQIGGWVPGAGREPAPEGTGFGVRPGSVLLVQMHYNTLTAEPQPDQSTILVATAPEVERPARTFLVTNPAFLAPGGMPIPAGEPNVHHEVSLPGALLGSIFGRELGITNRDPWVLHQGFIHMHNLGSSGRITLQRGNGTEQVLLDIRDWDFNWQSTYNFVNEVLISPGDRIRLECNWDNSQANQPFVNGEQLPARDVEWGDYTQDEMCLMSVLMTQPAADTDYSYRPSVHLESPAYRQQFTPGDLVPLQLLLNNFSLHEPGQHDHEDPAQHGGGEHDSPGDDHDGVYEGHYRVYLDTDDDEAGHLTAWDSLYYYQLPDDIEPGLHTLRVSLRGGDHHALGIQQTVEIEVVADPSGERNRLLDASAWVVQTAAGDNWPQHRPDTLHCPANSWYPEGEALEVETGYCEYLSLAQPSLSDVRAGDTLHLVLWHADLAFEEPASAHVAVSLAGEVIWEQEVAIPARAEIFDLRIPARNAAAEGSEIEFHLHNHGYNSWTLLQLDVER